MSNASSKDVAANHKIPVAPWNPWAGLGVAALTYVLAQVFALLSLVIYAMARNWPAEQSKHWLENSLVSHFVFLLLSSVFIVAAIYFFIRPHKNGLRSIGLRRPKMLDPVYGLAALPLYVVLYLVLVAIVSQMVPSLNVGQEQQLGFDGTYSGWQLVPIFISLVILPAITEEIMFRGFLYSTLKKVMSLPYAVVVTCLVFAMAHLPEGGDAGPLYIAAIDTFVLSLVMIYLREKTNGLWAGMTLHALKNGIAFVALFVLHAG